MTREFHGEGCATLPALSPALAVVNSRDGRPTKNRYQSAEDAALNSHGHQAWANVIYRN
jgi:hypothetical protein